MRAGQLRQRIAIEEKTVTLDDFGEPDETWSTHVNAWAAIEPLDGREYLESRAQAQSVSHEVRLRHRDGVTPEMRVVHDGRVFEIESVLNEDERDRELILMCREMV